MDNKLVLSILVEALIHASSLSNCLNRLLPNQNYSLVKLWCIVCFFLRFSFNGSLSEFSTAWPGGVDGGGDRANGKFQRENKKQTGPIVCFWGRKLKAGTDTEEEKK